MATLSPPLSPQKTNSSRPDRPRLNSRMSHASTQSHKSSRSRVEIDMTESTRDKRRLQEKSDPTKALQEAQPAAVALEESTLDDLRKVHYKDVEGNIIMDPDRSNPTRPRMERPLDTIRGFNAAADGTTSRRSSYQRPPSQVGFDAQNRRSSYQGAPGHMAGPNGRPSPPRGQGGYYNRNSGHGPRPDAFQEEGPQYQGPPRQHMRYQSAPYMPRVSPDSTYSQQPYDGMTSGSDEASKSTNPSSQNSSFDQLHQMRKPDEYGNNNPYRHPVMHNGNGNGYNMRGNYPPSAFNNHYNGPPVQTDDYGIEYPGSPAPPQKQVFNMSMNGTTAADVQGTRLQKNGLPTDGKEQKRQSWIKRTFSKRN